MEQYGWKSAGGRVMVEQLRGTVKWNTNGGTVTWNSNGERVKVEH